ncbi:MAG: phosphatidate cytidylyltransferase [Methylocapsa sp.]|nr:phosphatidate cytidylyltransferase [Methylocapsa sp.]
MPNDTSGTTSSGPPAISLLRQRGLADLFPRLASAAVLMAAALASLWLGGLTFDLVWLGAALAVGYEWQNLIAAPRPRLRILFAALGICAGAFFFAKGGLWLSGAALAAAAAAAALAAGKGRSIWAFCGVAYAAALLLPVAALHRSPGFGTQAILWLFAIVWGTDVCAYFGGRLIGGPKLWPRISPSKTWSGMLSGILAGAVLGTLIAGFGPCLKVWVPLFGLGLAAAAISQAGDIFESWVKRRFGAKDSSRLIPGHGGFMDRLDGFIAAAAFAALVGAARGGPSVAAGLFSWG